MSPTFKTKRKVIKDSKIHSSLGAEPIEQKLNWLLKEVALEDVSLEERKREANKPLYLIRYE